MPAKNNTFQKNTFKTGNGKKQKSGAGESNHGSATFKKFVRNQRLRKAAGFFLVLLSVYLLLSFLSYLVSWKADDALLDGRTLNWALLTDGSIELENMMGRLGAIAAHLFIKKWFGIGSFLFLLIAFVVGIRLLTYYSILPLKKTVFQSLFFALWLSIFFGYIIGSGEWLILGGIFGYEISVWINGLIGKAGTFMFLIFSLGSLVIIVYDPNFRRFATLVTQAWNMIKPARQDKKHMDVSEDDSWGATVKAENPVHPDPLHDLDNEKDTLDEPKAQDKDVEEEPAPTWMDFDDEDNKSVRVKNENEPEFEVEIAGGKLTGSDYQAIDDPYSGADGDMPDLSHLGEFDPTLDLPKYRLPDLDLLDDRGSGTIQIDNQELDANKNKIIETLNNYAISIDKIKATVGPTVTLYEIVPSPGVRISKIRNLENDIALSLSALGIRIIAPIPGRGTIGIEVPNRKPEIVSMKSVLGSERFQNSSYELPIGLGKTIANETFIADLTKMPHLLMAGATGQGKSVGLNAILTSILYKKHPAFVKFVLVDPKKVELNLFSKIERHYLAKLPDAEEAIVTETRQVIRTINSLCVEMDNRYDLLKDAQARNIKEYNTKFVARRLNPNQGHRFLPYIILFIDEFADLIMTAGKEIELPIARLAQLARAVGIHLVIATQRPSVNIITGTIKANFPARIAFRVTAKVDSRTILDSGGADQLIGRGDMLLSTGSDLIRLQCAFIDTPEIERITEFIGSQRAYPDAFHLPEYLEDNQSVSDTVDPSERDELFADAARIVVSTQQGSTSLIQRKLKLGYNRAGRIIDQLEAAGIVGPFEGSKAREVKIKDELSLEQILRRDDL